MSIGTYYRAPIIPSNDLGNAAVETQFVDKQGRPINLLLQTDNQLANKRFILNLAGRVATTSNLTFTINIYLGITGTTADTLLFTSNAQTVNAVKTNWHLDVNLFWDGDSFKINGSGFGQLDNNQIGSVGLTNVPIIDPNLHNSSNSFQGVFYKFTVTGTFSGSSPGNHAYLDVMEMTA